LAADGPRPHAQLLFDGLVQDDEPMTVELLATEKSCDPNDGELQYFRRFDRDISQWIGKYLIGAGSAQLRGADRVIEIVT
jgi:hypothetical protein